MLASRHASSAPRAACQYDGAVSQTRHGKSDRNVARPIFPRPVNVEKTARDGLARLLNIAFGGRSLTEADAAAAQATGISIETIGRIRRRTHNTSWQNALLIMGAAAAKGCVSDADLVAIIFQTPGATPQPAQGQAAEATSRAPAATKSPA